MYSEIKIAQIKEITMINDWVESYADDLYRWVLKRTNDVQLSEDLVQETFLAAHQSFDKFEGKSSPKTWLTAILKYKLMDHFRKQDKKKEKVTSDFFFDDKEHWKKDNNPNFWGETEEHLLDNADFQKVLAECLTNLSDRSRIAITAKFLDEKKAEDICHDLEITTSNYWQLIHRAKLSLRNCLQLKWFKN